MAEKKQQSRDKQGSKKPAPDDKKAALSKALRENLHRRKAQARARKSNKPDQAPE